VPRFHLPNPGPRLAKAFETAGLKILDVGARKGPSPKLAPLGPYAELILVEPDPDEAARLEREGDWRRRWTRVRVLREALHDRSGTFDLHVLRQPGLSSLLAPDPEAIARYFGTGDLWDVVDRCPVRAVTLDEAAERHGFADVALIKLDTQGTELAILESGRRLTLPSAVVVQIEMLVHRFYVGQPSLADLHGFLESEGFQLVDLKRSTVRHHAAARPVWSKKEIVWCHGTYFRTRGRDGGAPSDAQAHRAFCLAVALEFFDRAIALVEDPARAAYFDERFGAAALIEDVRAYAATLWERLAPSLDDAARRAAGRPVDKDRDRER